MALFRRDERRLRRPVRRPPAGPLHGPGRCAAGRRPGSRSRSSRSSPPPDGGRDSPFSLRPRSRGTPRRTARRRHRRRRRASRGGSSSRPPPRRGLPFSRSRARASVAEPKTPGSRSAMRMFVGNAAGSSDTPRSPASSRASLASRAWSSGSRPRSSSSATSAAAARTPACRIPPPKSFLTRRASATNAFEPATALPTGARRPFEKQTMTESRPCASEASDTPRAAAAFQRRAPSRWTASPRFRARTRTSSMAGRGRTVPPAKLWVFSRQTTDVRGR